MISAYQGHEEDLLQALPDALLVVVGERIVIANRAARDLLAATDSQLLGRPLNDIVDVAAAERLATSSESSSPTDSVRLSVRRLDGSGDRPFVDCTIRRMPSNGGPLSGALLLAFREASGLVRTEKLIASLADLASNDVKLSGWNGLIAAAMPMFEEIGWWAVLLRTSPVGVEVVHLFAPEDADGSLMQFAEKVKSLGCVDWPFFPVVRKVFERGRPLFFEDAVTELSRVDGFGPELASNLQSRNLSRGAWVPIRSGRVTTHVLLVVGPGLAEHDLAALQLFAAKLGSSLRLEELQAELVRRERLAAVGEMAGVLAHEVRNPLAVIFNAVAGLRRALGDDETGLLGIIYEEADRLKRVVRDLVDFARPTVPEIRPIALAELIESALDMVQSEDPEGAIEVERCFEPGLPNVNADPHLLLRVLLNVLDNSFQSVCQDGRIRLTANQASGGFVELVVHNDGSSLTAEQLEKAFLPFYTTRATGTGLGLTVVKRIVEDLGGRVTLSSDETGVSMKVLLRYESTDGSLMEDGV